MCSNRSAGSYPIYQSLVGLMGRGCNKGCLVYVRKQDDSIAFNLIDYEGRIKEYYQSVEEKGI